MAHKRIVIVGCGRLGGALANQLSLSGHEVIVIDRKEKAFEKLSVEFSGYRIQGDATEMHILKEARLENADNLFAVTTSDNINLMVAQVARTLFEIPRVVARVFDPNRESIYANFGIETISPTKLSADAFLKRV
ncbi:MAG TPA: TrkA family potassium uptake protein [Aggregatilineales bacterium]|nr:TrkA family potassium uptake protein [Aggregatilineales bacterium]